jgi:PST family polysaccharide transporter
LVITAYVIGLPYGPNGVAFAYSAAMTVWLVPHVLWCLHGTAVSPRELFLAIIKPLVSAIVAAAAAFGANFYLSGWGPPLLTLALDASVMIIVYYTMLLFVMGQATLYYGLIRDLRSPSRIGLDEAKDGSVS